MNQPVKPKTNRGELSQARIICATRDILAGADLSSLKLDAVAEKSGVAKSSILWHFGSKNGLLLAVVEDIFEGMQRLIETVDEAPLDANARLKRMMLLLADEMQRTPEANTLLISFIVNQTLDQTINAHIKTMYDTYRQFIEGILASSGVIVDGYSAATILAFIDGAFLQWHLQPEKINLQDLFVNFVGLLNLNASAE